MEMVFAYFSDASRLPRLADRVEEELVHHGSIVHRWNVNNANLTSGHGSQTSQLFTVPSFPSSIFGLLRSTALLRPLYFTYF